MMVTHGASHRDLPFGGGGMTNVHQEEKHSRWKGQVEREYSGAIMARWRKCRVCFDQSQVKEAA